MLWIKHIFVVISLIIAMILDMLDIFSAVKWIWPVWHLLFVIIWLTNERHTAPLGLLWGTSLIFDLTFNQPLGQNSILLLLTALILHTIYPQWSSKYSTINKFFVIWSVLIVHLWIELIIQHSISYLISWDGFACITRSLIIAAIWLWTYINFLKKEKYISLS